MAAAYNRGFTPSTTTRYARTPERFVRGRPVVALPPKSVAINPIAPGDHQPAADCVNFPTLTAAGYVK
jgi:hypothetical protein